MVVRVLLLVLVVVGVAATEPDWPCWRGPNGNGSTSTELALIDGWAAGGIPMAWAVDIPGHPGKPGGDRYAGSASPVVVAGKVYMYSLVVTGDTYQRLEESGQLALLSAKDNHDELRALLATCHDAESGKLLWSKAIPTKEKGWCSSGTPVVDNGLMFVHASPGGLICLDAETGAVKWTKGTISGRNGGYGKHGSLQARGGLLVADRCVLQATDGKVLRGKPNFVFGSQSCTISMVDGQLAIVRQGDIRALQTGQVLYDGFAGGGTPVAHGGFVAGFSDCSVGGRSKFHKALRVWRLEAGSLKKTVDIPLLGQQHSPILDAGRAYAFALTKSHVKTKDPAKIAAIKEADKNYQRGAFCVDVATGKILWSNTAYAASAHGMGIKLNNRLIAYSKEGIFMLDADSGKTLGTPSFGKQDGAAKPYRVSNLSSPACWNGRLYFRGGRTHFGGMALLCYDLRQP